MHTLKLGVVVITTLSICLAMIACENGGGEEEEHTESEDSMSMDDDMEMAEDEEHDDHDMSESGNNASEGGHPINVILRDQGPAYTMNPETHHVDAGGYTFIAMNEGLIEHELIVVKLLDMDTDLANLHVVNGQLVEVEDGDSVFITDEGGAHIGEFVAATGHGMHLEAGHTVELPANLVAGDYMLLCNIETHYQLGMWSEFTVT